MHETHRRKPRRSKTFAHRDRTGWRTSSYSGAVGNCVEVGHTGELIGVRDTKSRDSGTLTFPKPTWARFLTYLKTSQPPTPHR